MNDFTTVELFIIVLAFFAGGLLKGILGIALPAVALAIMVQTIHPLSASALMVLPVVASNFWQAMQGGVGDIGAVLRRYWLLIICCFTSITIVSFYAVNLPSDLVVMALGLTLILFASANFFAPHLKLPPRFNTPAAILAGLIGGLLGGATTAYGPPLNVYLVSLHLDKKSWIKAVGVIYTICGLPLLLGYSVNGMLSGHMVYLSALACIPAFAGMWLGSIIRGYIAQNLFRKILLWFLLIAGLSMLWRSVM